MFHPLSNRRLLWAAASLLFAAEASALTLGNAGGAVLIGRPLALSIPATLGPGESEAPCVEGELFHGDQRVRSAPQVRWVPGPGNQGTLRVNSPVPVSEPMVTLYLRVGCAQKVTRRYVLLADPPPVEEGGAALTLPGSLPVVPPAAQPRATPAPATVPSTRSAPAAAAAPEADRSPRVRPAPGATDGASGAGERSQPAAATANRRPPAGEGAASEATRPGTGVEAAPSRRRPDAAATPPGRSPGNAAPARPSRPAAAGASPRARGGEDAGATRPRLRLDPLDLAAERDPVLRQSTQLLTQPTTDAAARASAAALWQALRRTPEEAMQEQLRLQALQRDVAALRDATQQNTSGLAAMREQVHKARGERNSVSLLALVLAVLLLAGGALAWWRLRAQRREQAWYESGESLPPESGPPDLEEEDALSLPPVAAGRSTDVWPRPSSPAPLAPAALAPVAAAAAPLPAAATAAPAEAAPGPRPEFAPGEPASRTVSVEELIDVQDKADFFVSIGQPDQAVAVLESHVQDQVETSPLAWLDLLELYHRLGMREDYERLRAHFGERFAATVPPFDQYREQQGAGLEAHGRAMSRIVALWPSRRVLEVIEESIFRKPNGSDTFSLEAYRELILLYNVAKELALTPEDVPVAEAGAAASRPISGFPSTDLEPLPGLDLEFDDAAAGPEPLPPLDLEFGDVFGSSPSGAVPVAGADVDIDLSEPPPAPPRATPAPHAVLEPEFDLDLGELRLEPRPEDVDPDVDPDGKGGGKR